nr:Pvc16 family protein [uncultured Ralstonia sp.]
MIDHLDDLLRQLLSTSILRGGVPVLVKDTQLRFQPPDDDWRTLVYLNDDLALNVYLVDMRENRKLRTNERERMVQGSDVFEVPPPRRVDCHYLISAWSQAKPSAALDTTLDEHWLLAETARVLGAHDELDPVAIYALSNPPQLPPPPIAEERFPLTLLPVEGFPKYAEFWGTMGDKNRWKPCIYTVITVALKEQPLRAGPMVTTTFTRTLVRDNPATENTRFHIGGIVYDNAVPPLPVALAWVELLTPANQRIAFTRADALGRFVFADVAAGAWQVRASAMPQGVSPPRAITVPEPTGNYDISF